MPQLQLVQGAYEARSVIANAQRCVNLYPEQNTKDAEAPFTHYCTPGLVTLCQGQVGEVRALYTASNGLLFAVIGDGVYYIPDSFVPQLLGNIGTASGHVSLYDNTFTLVVLDGSVSGWSVDLATLAFGTFAPTNFVGGNQIRYLDTFLLSSTQGGNLQSSDSGTTNYTALAVATITGDADKLQIIDVVNRYCWLFGKRSIEVWGNVGGSPFPLAPVSGVFIQHGIGALRSLAHWGQNLFWLSVDNNGEALVFAAEGYKESIISTPALVDEFSSYAQIEDAIGFCYQQGAHIFYVLTFPTADRTWVFDLSTRLWHERVWLDGNGQEHRHRANCVAYAYGKTICGDWQNGKLYHWDINAYDDDGSPILRLRSFPHVLNGGDRMSHKQFSADMEVGTFSNPAIDPLLSLRWSDDRGRTYGNALTQSLGHTGEYRTIPSWNRLGMARDRVYELSWSVGAPTALNGAWLDAEPQET